MSNIRNARGSIVWQFEDSTGKIRQGYMEGYSDFGGTDVPYYFRDVSDNSFHVVSGQRLKNAHPVRQS
jgi:hypothetical protein